MTCSATNCCRPGSRSLLFHVFGDGEGIRHGPEPSLTIFASTLAITAILDLVILAAAREHEANELMLRVSHEALDTGVALGYPLPPIFGFTADEMGSAQSVVELSLDRFCAGFVLPHTTTTVVHDWTKGRHSEIDDVNGLVVAELAPARQSCTAKRAIVEVAHLIECGDLKPGPAKLFCAKYSDFSKPAIMTSRGGVWPVVQPTQAAT
jgi:2-dehydropantoate 2-reductase